MDGIAAHFTLDLLDAPAIGASRRIGPGILYAEDFDLPAPDADGDGALPEIIEPTFSAAELAAARAAGYEAGRLAAVTDARLVEGQLQRAALQGIADALTASRTEIVALAEQQAEATARTVLAMLAAALPAVMERHAAPELTALITALLPGLRHEARLRIRTHPDLAESIDALLASALDTETQWNVEPDARLSRADIAIAWRDGGTARNSRAICEQVCAVLGNFGLAGIGVEPVT